MAPYPRTSSADCRTVASSRRSLAQRNEGGTVARSSLWWPGEPEGFRAISRWLSAPARHHRTHVVRSASREGCQQRSAYGRRESGIQPITQMLPGCFTGLLRPLAGVVCGLNRFQGWRSFLAQPLAKSLHPCRGCARPDTRDGSGLHSPTPREDPCFPISRPPSSDHCPSLPWSPLVFTMSCCFPSVSLDSTPVRKKAKG